MAGTVVADTLQAASTSTLVLKNGVANTPPTIQDSAGTQIGTFCRAWVNFNGTSASPITPRGSFNVSSVTKPSTGQYTVTFTVAMPDANYSTQVSTSDSNRPGINSGATASAVGVTTRNNANTLTDLDPVTVAVFR